MGEWVGADSVTCGRFLIKLRDVTFGASDLSSDMVI